jgi:methyl-accepting chemotaxis protein
MMLRNMNIGSRLAAGFGVILVVMISVSVGGTAIGKKSRDDLARVVAAAGAKESLASTMKTLVLERSSVMRNVGLYSDAKSMTMDEDRAQRLGTMYDEARARMAQLGLSDPERDILKSLDAIDKELAAPFRQAIALSAAAKNQEAAELILNELDPPIQKSLFELNRLIELQKQANREAIEDATVLGDRMAWTVYCLNAAVLLFAILIAWAITRSITRPLLYSVQVARRVASGDLGSRIEPTGRDEATQLLEALRDMNDGLARIVLSIRFGADSIAVGAGQVAAGNQSLSSRTEEHASSLQETASTLEQFTATVKQNADRAGQASELAATASVTAEKGGEVVGKVVSTMQEVTSSSRRISDIIAVIDGISFQTNILALNAAVEAARAGEEGRGFAVVAAEVRSLAQRSAASAKEIRGLIEHSVSRIEAGARLVDQAGHTMDELVGSVRRVAEIMTQIAAASHEQSSGIEQINRAITQMDNVVQMNASLVEEATAAATSMASQATSLAHAVAQFRIEESGNPLEPVPGAAPTARGHAMLSGSESNAPARIASGRREPVLTTARDEDWKEF